MQTPSQMVEAVIKGGRAERIPFTIYENKIPRCAAERTLRNQGLCIIQRKVLVYKTLTPNVEKKEYIYTKDGQKFIETQYITPKGTLNTIDEDAGYTRWTRKHLFTKPEDYKPLFYLFSDLQYEPNYEAFEKARAEDGGDSFFRGTFGTEPMQELISYTMGPETFSLEWYDNRDEIIKLYEALVEKRRILYPICADSPCLAFNYGGNVVPELLGLDRFEQYYVPHYNEAADILHKKGKLIGVHFDANMAMIADAIAKAKLDYIEAFSPAPDTNMSVAQARQAWKDKVLWINFPSCVHLESQEQIAQMAESLIQQAGSLNGFMMGIMEDIPPERWQQNMLTISRVLNSHRM